MLYTRATLILRLYWRLTRGQTLGVQGIVIEDERRVLPGLKVKVGLAVELRNAVPRSIELK